MFFFGGLQFQLHQEAAEKGLYSGRERRSRRKRVGAGQKGLSLFHSQCQSSILKVPFSPGSNEVKMRAVDATASGTPRFTEMANCSKGGQIAKKGQMLTKHSLVPAMELFWDVIRFSCMLHGAGWFSGSTFLKYSVT